MKICAERRHLANSIKVLFVIMAFLGFISESPCSELNPYSLRIISTESSTSANIQQLIFSATKHSRERSFVVRHEHIRHNQLKTGKIYITLVDLNDDGIKEIISYIRIFDYCGRETGCPLNIYKIEKGKLMPLLMLDQPRFFKDGFPMFIEIDNAGKQNVIAILSTKTMGWHDILINGETVWKWYGSYYTR